jgi:hypothetical protein
MSLRQVSICSKRTGERTESAGANDETPERRWRLFLTASPSPGFAHATPRKSLIQGLLTIASTNYSPHNSIFGTHAADERGRGLDQEPSFFFDFLFDRLKPGLITITAKSF